MASNVVVIDKFFNRATIKVTPGTYMSEVVSEACKKLGKKDNNYDLKRNNDKAIDLSQTYRQTGLTTGAKLTLVEASRSPAPVSIALQLPQDLASAVSGGRLKDIFPSNTTLWLILRKFESTGSPSAANLNFTGRGVARLQDGESGAGRMVYEMPVLNVMGREMSTFGDLQKTLANLGVNKGTALLRLTFRQTDQPIEEAMKEIGEYFREEENAPEPGPGPTAETQQQGESVTDAIANLPSPEHQNEDTNMDSDPSDTTPYSTPTPAGAATNTTSSNAPSSTTDPSASPAILGPDGLPLTIFSAPSNSTPLAALTPHNESDYIPTIRHAKLVQSRLQNSSQNIKLLSYDEEIALETERLARLSKIREIPLRIRFPDQMAVSKSITNEAHGKWLYEYVRGLIVHENEPFKLIYQGNKGREIIPDEENKFPIKGLGILGPTVINLAWEDANSERLKGKPVLKEVYREKATQQPVPVVESGEDKEEEVEKKVEGKKDDGGEKKKKGLSSLIMKNLKKR